MHYCRNAHSVAQFFDETWKDIQFGGVEGWWGLFYAKYVSLSPPHSPRTPVDSYSPLPRKTLKPITLPDCEFA